MQECVRLRLEAMAEPAYRDFSSALIPGCGDMLGVRLPALRALSKELCRGDWEQALAGEDRYFEERMLRGFVLAGARIPDGERIERIRAFLPLIENWSVCDSFCNSLHCMKKDPDAYWPLLMECLASDREFSIRFAVVSMLCHYLDTPYLPQVLTLLPKIDHPGFYVHMAVAWALATAYLRAPEEVLGLLRAGTLERETHNLTISKLRDSRRVPQAVKELLPALRR